MCRFRTDWLTRDCCCCCTANSTMLPPLEAHEIIVWEQPNIDVKLAATDGSVILAKGCNVRLSNQHIAIEAPTSDGVTYRVKSRGDREFHTARIPIVNAKPHRLVQPWFGPYKWETLISGPAPEGLQPQTENWTLSLTFSSGGVFEYRQNFLRSFAEASQAASEGIAEVLPPYEE